VVPQIRESYAGPLETAQDLAVHDI
jgi:hypothetical protein